MPTRSYEEFEQTIAQFQAAPTPQMLQDLIADTFAIDADDVDDEMIEFTRSRIDLAYRTGNVRTHLRHLYDVLARTEQELGE